MKKERGFTLVELLVTLSLMTVVFGITASVFYGGSGVWKRIRCGTHQEHAVYFAFDEIRRGLHGYHFFDLIPFKGQSDKLEFPALVLTENPKTGELAREPGRRGYYFDRSQKRLCASESPFRGMRRKRLTDQCRVLAENVEKVSFRYQEYRPNTRSFSWRGSWSEKGVPVAVKMEWEYADLCSETKSKKQFLIAIPAGSIG